MSSLMTDLTLAIASSPHAEPPCEFPPSHGGFLPYPHSAAQRFVFTNFGLLGSKSTGTHGLNRGESFSKKCTRKVGYCSYYLYIGSMSGTEVKMKKVIRKAIRQAQLRKAPKAKGLEAWWKAWEEYQTYEK